MRRKTVRKIIIILFLSFKVINVDALGKLIRSLVTVRGKSLSICNCIHVKLLDSMSSKNRTFQMNI